MSQQLDHWRGSFGEEYIERNEATPEAIRIRTRLWAEILQGIAGEPPSSILEIGANIGINLRALSALTDAALYAIEPNDRARKILEQDQVVARERILNGSASQIQFPDKAVDLIFTSGVLIHIHPNELERACREIYRCSRRFIVCIEYFSDKPQNIPYRGRDDLLFKRDFGGFWLDLFPTLVPVRWGFGWRRATGLDNLTWWLFKK